MVRTNNPTVDSWEKDDVIVYPKTSYEHQGKPTLHIYSAFVSNKRKYNLWLGTDYDFFNRKIF